MAKIDLDNLIGNMSPEQKIFVSGFYSQFDNRSAANRRIINVEPLYYNGVIAGTEFLTYAATKLYLTLSLVFPGGVGALFGYIQTYNEANAASHVYTNSTLTYNTTTPILVYINNILKISNIYFSRFTNANHTYMTFIGYRITLV